MKGGTPCRNYVASTTANFYTNQAGCQVDWVKDPNTRNYVYECNYNQEVDATLTDDGKVIGALATYEGQEMYGAYSDNLSLPTLAFNTTDDYTAFVTTPKSSTFRGNWNKIVIADAIHIRWTSNIIINSGDFAGMACSLIPSSDWKIMWTGQTMVDYYLSQAGKYVVTAIQDVILNCHNNKPLDFELQWKIQFGRTWKTYWNFIVSTTIDAISNSWFDVSLTPAITYATHDELYPHRQRKPNPCTSLVPPPPSPLEPDDTFVHF